MELVLEDGIPSSQSVALELVLQCLQLLIPVLVQHLPRQRLAHPTYGQSGTPRYGMCCLQNENTYHRL